MGNLQVYYVISQSYDNFVTGGTVNDNILTLSDKQGNNVVLSGFTFSGGSGTTLPPLSDGQIWIGDVSNLPVGISLSGDATLNNIGILTISNDSIGDDKISTHTSTKISILDPSQLNTDIVYNFSASTENTIPRYGNISNEIIPSGVFLSDNNQFSGITGLRIDLSGNSNVYINGYDNLREITNGAVYQSHRAGIHGTRAYNFDIHTNGYSDTKAIEINYIPSGTSNVENIINVVIDSNAHNYSGHSHIIDVSNTNQDLETVILHASPGVSILEQEISDDVFPSIIIWKQNGATPEIDITNRVLTGETFSLFETGGNILIGYTKPIDIVTFKITQFANGGGFYPKIYFSDGFFQSLNDFEDNTNKFRKNGSFILNYDGNLPIVPGEIDYSGWGTYYWVSFGFGSLLPPTSTRQIYFNSIKVNNFIKTHHWDSDGNIDANSINVNQYLSGGTNLLDIFSLTGHTHVTSDITGLDSALQDRSLTGHTHNNLYSLTSHTHSFSALTNTGHTHVTQEVFINKLPSTSDFSLQDFITTSWSCGRISGGTIVDNLDGTITVSGGTGMVRTSDSIDANLIYFEWEANNSLSLADREVNYVYVDYNGGTPIVTSETNYQNINQTTQFAIGTIFKRDNDLFFSDIGLEISNFPRKVQRRIQESFGYQRTSGLLTAHIGVRNVYVTAGVLWYQLNRIDINAFNSSTGDEFTVYYRHPTTGWTFTTGVTQISNTEYDNNDVAPATLGNNNYGVWWVYITPNGEVTILMGQGNYNQLSQAQSATIPVGLPPIIKYYSLFLAKIIIKKNDSAFIDVQLPFDTLIGYTNANNHNELSTLQGGTTDEYYHLTLDQVTNVDNIPNLQIGSFGISIDGSGSVISPGIKGFTMFVNDMTITSWHILSDLSGTCKIDIWKNSTIPTSADTITGTELPELNSQQINSDTNLSTWNTTILANDIVYFNVISATTVTKINLVIKTIKN